MLELLVLVFLLFITVHAFWKKGVLAGVLLGVALLFHLASAFLRSAERAAGDDAFPFSLILKGIGLVFLLVGIFKFYSKRRGAATTA